VNTNLRKTIGQFTVALVTAFTLTALAPRVDAQGGIPLWTNRYTTGGACGGPGVFVFVVVDSGSNVIVTGGPTIKYSNAGVPLWTNS
jgi:hypothetical protein